MIFRVLEENEPSNLLIRQAYTEVFNQELEEARLREAFNRIKNSEIIIKYSKSFTPLSFPLKVDGLRGTMTNEDLQKRIERIKKQMLKFEA